MVVLHASGHHRGDIRRGCGGVMRIWTYLHDAASGPGSFRLVVQPLVSLCVGALAGLRDARQGRPPYFAWAIHQPRGLRRAAFGLAARQLAFPFAFAFVLDLVLQHFLVHVVRPRFALMVAILLIVLPYLVARGLVNRGIVRLSRWGSGARHAPDAHRARS
jgi:hypothetical protein